MPSVHEHRLLTLRRPAARNTAAADISVSVCTLTPPNAPPSVRPRYVQLSLTGPRKSVTIAIRRVELAPVLHALADAHRSLYPETFIDGAGI